MKRSSIRVERLSATELRDRLKSCLPLARGNKVVLVESGRRPARYLVDKKFLDSLIEERESMLATLEILDDRELADRLLTLSKRIDEDLDAGRLLTTVDVFGE